MKSKLIIITFMLALFALSLQTQLTAESSNYQSQNVVQENSQNTESIPNESKKDSGVDWFELIIIVGYLGGVFVLLPIVLYTNAKEKLFVPDSTNQDQISVIQDLTEEQRNQKAMEILERIESKLTVIKGEDGTDWVTITKGSQAKFMKYGLDYINKKLKPTDQNVIDRINEFTNVYNDRTRRAFTGSNWIIGSSALLAVLFYMTGGISVFLFIHILGLVFYILSSRTTFYGIEKRMKTFGNGPSFISGMMSGLFLGNGVKYYVKEGSGPWRRDWETEGQMALIGLFLLIVVAIFLGIFAAFLGVLNFIINYSTSFLHPFKTEEKWYQENFAK